VLLNNDTVAAPGAIAAMCEAIEQEADLGAVAAASNLPRDLFQYRRAPVNRRHLTPADYLTAVCLAVRRCAVGTTLFDVAYSPGYCEDLDLSCRLRTRGWRLAIAEHALVHHVGGGTFGPPERSSLFARNYATFTARWGWLPTHVALDDVLRKLGTQETAGV
jgi:GT2 family glycosyltransferase